MYNVNLIIIVKLSTLSRKVVIKHVKRLLFVQQYRTTSGLLHNNYRSKNLTFRGSLTARKIEIRVLILSCRASI